MSNPGSDATPAGGTGQTEQILRLLDETEGKRHLIVNAFERLLTQALPAGEIADTGSLPFPKDRILECLILEIIAAPDQDTVDYLSEVARWLSFFQDGVGSRRLSPLPDLADLPTGSAEDLWRIVEMTAAHPDHEAHRAFSRVQEQDAASIALRIDGALAVRERIGVLRKRASSRA